MDKKSTINYVLLPSGLFAGIILTIGLTSMAEDSELDAGPRVIPYNGVLEFNGTALNGQADLNFMLTDDPSGENVNCLFEEEHDNITAYNGRFGVNIGSVEGDLPDCVFDSEAMYIEIGVRNAESVDDYVVLTGSQRIHPVPFSYWAAEGSDFKIDGALSVSGAISDPDSAVTIDDDLTVSGKIEPSSGGNGNGIDWPDNPFGGGGDSAWIRYYQDGDGEDAALQIGIGNDGVDDLEFFQNGEVRAYIANNFFIDTNLRISGNIQDTDGDVILDDDARVTGVLDVRGNIQDDNDSEVVINDSLEINGRLDIQNSVLIGDDDSGSLEVADDVTVGSDGSGNLTVNGQLNLQDAVVEDAGLGNDSDSGNDTLDASKGCVRLDTMQMCWGTFYVRERGAGDSTTFSKSFGNTTPTITATAIAGTERIVVVNGITASGFNANIYNQNGSDRDETIHYTAFGEAGSNW